MLFSKNASLPATILVCTLMLAGCGGPIEPQTPVTGNIMGAVLDATTSNPIRYAGITTIPATESILTNGEGLYWLNSLQPGTYKIIVKKSGYKDASVELKVNAGKTTFGNAQLDSNKNGNTSNTPVQ